MRTWPPMAGSAGFSGVKLAIGDDIMVNNDVTRTPFRANPVPLGLACFGISVFMLAGYLWGAIPAETLVATALFVGGAGMLGAGVVAYRRGDDLDTTWMTAYGLFWAALAFYMWFFAPHSPAIGKDLAWIAFAWGIFTAYIFVVSLRAKSPLISAQLILFFILFLFIWIAGAFHMAGADRVAAIAGFITAIVAAIESCAVVALGTSADSPSVTRLGTGALTRHTPGTT
jgi:succinate-acetate transporter protein